MSKKVLVASAILLSGLVVGAFIAQLASIALAEPSDWVDVTLAFSWGSYKNQPGTHAAHVFAEPDGEGLSVRLHVYVGRGSKNYLDYGEIGRVKTYSEALKTWGTINWSTNGVFVGGQGRGQLFTFEEIYQKKLCDSRNIQYRIK